MTYPLVLDLAADNIPVAVTCRVLGFSQQAFYAWKHNPVSRRDRDDAYLINADLNIHADMPSRYAAGSTTCPAPGHRR